ncbi:MAG: hypothetical protein H7Y38_10945 [Armatimonadetes bacterium]|nr:hypothetical protein [Armatimonadota bacterium]
MKTAFTTARITFAVSFLVALSAFAPRIAVAQNLITNPGFEDGTTGWTLTGNGVGSPYFNYSLTPTPSFETEMLTFNGGQAAPNAVLSQSFATTPGTSYLVSFVYGNYYNLSDTATQSVTADAVNTANSAVLNSAIVTDTALGNQTTFVTVMDTMYTFSFTATGINTTLRFTDSALSTTANSDGILDNVSVVAVVPEVGTLSLCASGASLCGVIVLRRRPVTRK